MRQFTSPLQELFVEDYQLTDEDDIYVTYSNKKRKVNITVTENITVESAEDGTKLYVPLTQEQTGSFACNEPVSIQVNWIDENGQRMATCVTNVLCEENLIKEVIT